MMEIGGSNAHVELDEDMFFFTSDISSKGVSDLTFSLSHKMVAFKLSTSNEKNLIKCDPF